MPVNLRPPKLPRDFEALLLICHQEIERAYANAAVDAGEIEFIYTFTPSEIDRAMSWARASAIVAEIYPALAPRLASITPEELRGTVARHVSTSLETSNASNNDSVQDSSTTLSPVLGLPVSQQPYEECIAGSLVTPTLSKTTQNYDDYEIELQDNPEWISFENMMEEDYLKLPGSPYWI